MTCCVTSPEWPYPQKGSALIGPAGPGGVRGELTLFIVVSFSGSFLPLSLQCEFERAQNTSGPV